MHRRIVHLIGFVAGFTFFLLQCIPFEKVCKLDIECTEVSLPICLVGQCVPCANAEQCRKRFSEPAFPVEPAPERASVEEVKVEPILGKDESLPKAEPTKTIDAGPPEMHSPEVSVPEKISRKPFLFAVYSNKPIQINGMDLDAFGAIYVVGTFEDELDIPTKKKTQVSGKRLFVMKFSPFGDVVWSYIYPKPSYGKGIAVEPKGYVYLTGSVIDNSDEKALLLRMNSGGQVVEFPKKAGTTEDGFIMGGSSRFSVGMDVALSKAGGVYWVVNYTGALAFPLKKSIGKSNAIQNRQEMLIGRMNDSGIFEWALIGGGGYLVKGQKLTFDFKNERLYVTGVFVRGLSFPRQGPEIVLNMNTDEDVFLLKIKEAPGTLKGATTEWGVGFGASRKDTVEALDLNVEGDPQLVGRALAPFRSSPCPKGKDKSTDGAYIIKFDKSGSCDWVNGVKKHNNVVAADSHGYGISLSGGAAFISGTFQHAVFIGNGTLRAPSTKGNNNTMFAAKVDGGGEFQKAVKLGEKTIINQPRIKYDRGSLFITGSFQGNLESLESSFQPKQGYKYGAFLWKRPPI